MLCSVFLFLSVGCSKDNVGTHEPGVDSSQTRITQKAPFDNVVLIIADTLRSDVIGAYGNRIVETPNIDSLAGRGLLFERCISQSSTTGPSHASIFTSSYPKDHGVYDHSTKLGEDWITLAEVFKKNGFDTAAFVSSAVLQPELGYGQGFDYYSSIPPLPPYQRDSEQTNSKVFEYLDKRGDKPFFLWVHYFDTHGPYDAPEPYKNKYLSLMEKSKDSLKLSEILDPAIPSRKLNANWYGQYAGEHDTDFVISRYYGEVSYQDFSVGQLISKLAEMGILEKTLVVFTADHGESLTEHGIYFTHIGLYREAIDVPLIIAGPAATRIKTTVSLIDLYPTILDLMGIEVPIGLRGTSLVRSASEKPVQKPAISEHAWGYAVSMIEGKYKFILYLKDFDLEPQMGLIKGKVQMFDLAVDPYELVDIAGENERKVDAFRVWIDKWLKNKKSESGRRLAEDADKDFKRMLESLGYVR